MNAFIEHHQPAIRFDYACFDRILLNGVIQVLQNPACVVGFLKEKRQATRVTRHRKFGRGEVATVFRTTYLKGFDGKEKEGNTYYA
jgi:hypothetical protein